MITLAEYKGIHPNFAYAGDLNPAEWAVMDVMRTRDSDALERSNFEVISGTLDVRFGHESADGEHPDTHIVRFGHFACGWIAHIVINLSNRDLVAAAAEWESRIDDYPVADEDHWSNLQFDDAIDAWESYGRSDLRSAIARVYDPESPEIDDAIDAWMRKSEIDDEMQRQFVDRYIGAGDGPDPEMWAERYADSE